MINSEAKGNRKRGGNGNLSQFITCILLVSFVAALPSLLFWLGNANELSVVQGLWPVLLSLLIGAAIYFICWLVADKDCAFSCFIGLLISFLLLNFGSLIRIAESLLPFMHKAVAAILIAVILSVVVIFAAIKLRKFDIVPTFITVFCLVLAAIFVMDIVNIAINRPKLIEPSILPAAESDESLPDIYLFIADEMGDFYTMEKYYGIDSESNNFRLFLEEKGFNLSENSSNYANHTTWCTANLLSLDYVCEYKTTNGQARRISRNAEWYKILAGMGYSSVQCSSHTGHYRNLVEISDVPISESLISNITYDGQTVLDVFLERTILSLIPAFDDDSLTVFDRWSAKLLQSRMDRVEEYYADPASYDNDAPMAVHTYLLAPHTPFYTDAQGNVIPSVKRCDWADTALYRGQWEFTAQYLQRLFSNIIENNPDAIIILQSDHGVRGGLYTENTVKIELEDQCRIFNAVYFGGKEFNISGLSGINTLRLILTELGEDYPPIEDPENMYYQDSPLFATGG